MDKKDRPYSVQPYNQAWSRQFQSEKQILSEIFSFPNVHIEHVGSTSVEGMWAKPQIDILVLVDDLQEARKRVLKMDQAGYKYLGDYSGIGEEYFVRDTESGERKVSVHVFLKDNPQAKTQLWLREYLRSHPKEAQLYSQAKKSAYDEGKNDRVEYTKAKMNVLTDLIARAADWGKKSLPDIL